MTTLSILIAAWLAGITPSPTPTVCAAGTHYMLVADAHVPASNEGHAACIRVPVVTLCGAPYQMAWLIESEAREIPCSDLAPEQVRSVPVAEVYPQSIVGFVGRHAVEGEWPVAAVAPAWSVCQGRGCYCAGKPEQCEAIPIGGPRDYWRLRLCRLNPEACE